MAQNDRNGVVDYKKVCALVVAIALLPVLLVTYYWWGYRYYAAVIR